MYFAFLELVDLNPRAPITRLRIASFTSLCYARTQSVNLDPLYDTFAAMLYVVSWELIHRIGAPGYSI